MRKISYNFLFVMGLMATLVLVGIFSANTNKVSANNNDVVTKIPKNMGVISVTTDEPMTVYIDGVEVGRTQGNQIKFEKVVTPGTHEVKIVNAQGVGYTKTETFLKGVRNCICLKTVKRTEEHGCPYFITVSGPEKVQEGDLVTFAALNSPPSNAIASTAPINYVWRVSPENARITSGLGTSSITIDTTGLGRQQLRADVDVSDGVYDAQCRQRIAVNTNIEPLPTPTPIQPYKFDDWDARAFDDDKARLDQFAVELQNKPDSQGYIIMYQGTDKVSVRTLTVEKLSKRTLNYLSNVRFIPPNRVQTVQHGTTRIHTRYEVWIVPPGANPPVPREE